MVAAAVEEDAAAVAVSSYQGGHVEYFTNLVECLREERTRSCGHRRPTTCTPPCGTSLLTEV